MNGQGETGYVNGLLRQLVCETKLVCVNEHTFSQHLNIGMMKTSKMTIVEISGNMLNIEPQNFKIQTKATQI